jgi:hypothetical protein
VVVKPKTPKGQSREVIWTVDLRILWDPSQLSIYKGRVALDPLVRRLGTLKNLRCGVLKSSKAQSNESRRIEDASRLFLTVRSRLWSTRC